MKKVTTNGAVIKHLREQLEQGSLQKEMSHTIGISPRKLRNIENGNDTVTIPVLNRIAKYLGVSPEKIAFAVDTPRLVPSKGTTDSVSEGLIQDQVIPRFDKDIARAVADDGRIVYDAQNSDDLTVQFDVSLTTETSEYAEELIRLLTSVTLEKRDWNARPAPADEIALTRRVRQLLVLLKGNDVWTYYTRHIRHLPERTDLPPPSEPRETKFRLAIAFGPPGEYGENTIQVDVDNGQPYLLKGWVEMRGGK